MFNAEKFIAQQIKKIKNDVMGRAIIAASGGVDSTVCAALVGRALGERLLAVYVDTGFMRKGETESVDSMLRRLGVNHIVVDASDEYFAALRGVIEPETKRKIIGEKFIRIFEREAKKFGAEYLVQGTIAPDWIESGGGLGDTINAHHHAGGGAKEGWVLARGGLNGVPSPAPAEMAEACQVAAHLRYGEAGESGE